jgi:hypothetical protein
MYVTLIGMQCHNHNTTFNFPQNMGLNDSTTYHSSNYLCHLEFLKATIQIHS